MKRSLDSVNGPGAPRWLLWLDPDGSGRLHHRPWTEPCAAPDSPAWFIISAVTPDLARLIFPKRRGIPHGTW